MLGARLRHRVSFERQVVIQTSEGDADVSWESAPLEGSAPVVLLVNVPAEVLTGPGRELRAAGTTHAEVAARIVCRWFPGLDAAWRIRHGAVLYNIGSIETDATGSIEYRIRCTAGVNDGR